MEMEVLGIYLTSPWATLDKNLVGFRPVSPLAYPGDPLCYTHNWTSYQLVLPLPTTPAFLLPAR